MCYSLLTMDFCGGGFLLPKKKYAAFVEMAAAFILLCIIWGHSMMPPAVSSAESDWVAGLMDAWLPLERLTFWVRKAAHFTEFAAWGAVAFLNLRRFSAYRLQAFFNTLFAGLFVAVVDEFIQLFSGRGSLVSDVVLDFCGCLFGALVCVACLKLWTAHKNNKREVGSDE